MVAHVVDKQVIGNIARLRLGLEPGARFCYRAGQYLKVVLADGKRRPFSIANAPSANGQIELHVRRVDGGDFSALVFGPLAVGDLLCIEGPFGTLNPDTNVDVRQGSCEHPTPILLIAGGIGFAPIKAIAEHLLRAGSRRPIALYWGARRRDELYDHALVGAWEREHANFRYVPVISDDDTVADMRHGLIHEVVLQDHPRLSEHEVYLSGPLTMIRNASVQLLAAGLSEHCLHYDRHDEPAAFTQLLRHEPAE